MHILLAGGSGFLGSHLSERLRSRSHQVTTLVRRPAGPNESTWDPYAGQLDQSLVDAADVVVNLAGSPTAGNPHSQAWADELRRSRVATTSVLAEAIARSPVPAAYLAGNGISIYGDHGDEVLTEESDSRGNALLTEVCRVWEAAARSAIEAGSRVCILRTSPVMDQASAPLKQLRLLFLTGLGARLGNGRQYMAMISLRDWIGAVVHLAEHPDAAGPFNLCCPQVPTNAEFTRALAAALHRPAPLLVPGVVLRVGAGRMAPELLGSLHVRPAALETAGYAFADHDVTDVLASGLATRP